MRKTKKQLLGIAGLAAVGIMTAVAYTMPTPGAAAIGGYECNDNEPGNECATADGGSQIKVVVSEGNPAASTSSPRDGSTVVDPNVQIITNYSEVTQLDYYLTYKNDDSTTVNRADLASYNPTETSGSHKFSVNIAQYGYGEYTLHTTAHGYNGAMREDTVTFSFRPITVNFTDKTAENHDPILNIASNSDVKQFVISVYNKAGEPLFVDKDGNEVPLVVNRDDVELTENGEALITLPFEKYGAPAGEYTAVVIARNANDETISMATATTNYAPIVPDTPNTGAGFLAGLNITRLDYLLTGLIAFGLVSGFALYLVCRKNHR